MHVEGASDLAPALALIYSHTHTQIVGLQTRQLIDRVRGNAC